MKFEEENKTIFINVKKKCGIYFLIANEEVVYVGQSKNIFVRIGVHYKDKIFDDCYFFPCDKEDLDYYEDFYIKKYKPMYNLNNNGEMNFTINKIKAQIRDEYNLHITPTLIVYIATKLGCDVYIQNFNNLKAINKKDYDIFIDFIQKNKEILLKIKSTVHSNDYLFKECINLYFRKNIFVIDRKEK